MGKGLPRSLGRGAGGRVIKSEIIRQDIPVKDLLVTVTSTGAATGFGSAVIEGLPEGHLLYLGATCTMQMAGGGADANLVDTWSGDFGVGTTPAADATITAGDVDVIPSTAIGPAVAEVSPVTPGVSTTALAAVMFDNSAADLELNLNVLIDAADIVDNQSVILTVNGVLQIAYVRLGDD